MTGLWVEMLLLTLMARGIVHPRCHHAARPLFMVDAASLVSMGEVA